MPIVGQGRAGSRTAGSWNETRQIQWQFTLRCQLLEVDFRRVLRRHYKGRRNSSEKPIPKSGSVRKCWVPRKELQHAKTCSPPPHELALSFYAVPGFVSQLMFDLEFHNVIRRLFTLFPYPPHCTVRSLLMAQRVNYRRYANGILNRSHSVGPLLCLFKA